MKSFEKKIGKQVDVLKSLNLSDKTDELKPIQGTSGKNC